jgi:hypothetical protein
MFPKYIRAALFFVVLACVSLSCSNTSARATEIPARNTGTPARNTDTPVRNTGTPAPNTAAPVQNTATPSLATVILYTQSPTAGGGLYQSSRNGTDYDQYVWDDFTLPSGQAITEIRWRGGYDPARFGSGGPVLDFTVAIYPSIAGGSQPAVTNPPLVQYQTGGNAGETPAGPSGNIAMYDYSSTMPAPFQATGGTTYWVYIEATQGGIPDWGLAAGGGGDGKHFLGTAGGGDIFYQIVPGDAAFTLLGPGRTAYLPLIGG